MTDRLSLANALAEAKIDRPAAERIATEIFEAIHDSVATKQDLERIEAALRADMQRLEAATKQDLERIEAALRADMQRLEAGTKADIAALGAELRTEMALLEDRLLTRLGGLAVVLTGLLFAALRYLPPPH
jgi:hypothetical protein